MSSWVNVGGWRDLRREGGDFSTKVKGGGLPVSFFRIPPLLASGVSTCFPSFTVFCLSPVSPLPLHSPLFSLPRICHHLSDPDSNKGGWREKCMCAAHNPIISLSLSSPLSSFSHVVRRRRCPTFALPQKSERRGDSPNFSGRSRWANNHVLLG